MFDPLQQTISWSQQVWILTAGSAALGRLGALSLQSAQNTAPQWAKPVADAMSHG